MQSAHTIQQLADLEEGIPLWGCLPGSPSARAGLRYGDIITWIGPHRVKSVGDYARAIKARDDVEVRVRFIRDGAQREAILVMADAGLDFEDVVRHVVDERMIPLPRDGEDNQLPEA